MLAVKFGDYHPCGSVDSPVTLLADSCQSQENRILRKKFSLFEARAMSNTSATVSGYVISLPRHIDPRQAGVAIVQDGIEYRVLPRGAGIDLDDEVNVAVEATGQVEEEDGIFYLTVRGYKVLEDDAWLED